MLAYLLIFGIAYGIAHGITSTGLHLWRAILGFALAFVVAWLGGSLLGAFLITWMKWGDANSLLPIIDRGFLWALLGAGVGVNRAKHKLRTGETAPPLSIPKWIGKSTLGIFLIGIMAAIALPQYQDYKRRASQQTFNDYPNDKSVSAASASPHPSGSFTYEEAIGQQSEKKIEQTPAVSSAAVNWSDFTPVPKPSSAPPVPSAQEVHMQRIYAVHPDANEIYMSADFTRWLTRTPKFKHVTADGTTQEVIDMFSAYKRRSKAENQRLDQNIERRNDAAAEALARQSTCQYKAVMTDDDYFACGVNPPSHLQN